VIVFSVTISFFIQDVLNDREKIELKNKGLEGVLRDLEEDKKFFVNTSNVISTRIKLTEDILEGNISNKNLRSVMLTWGFTGQDSNFKSLISTGVVEYIDNDSLTLELSRYYEHSYALLNDISEQYKEHYLELSGFMRTNYPVNSMDKLQIKNGKIDFDGFRDVISFKYNDKIINQFQDDFKFNNYLYQLKKIKLFYLMFYENAINQIEKLSKIIMTELNLKEPVKSIKHKTP
jgi:hypothetical protein